MGPPFLTGNKISALIERARQGVKVHVLLDWVGSAKMDDSMLAAMRDAGVQVRKFHPSHWSHLVRMVPPWSVVLPARQAPPSLLVGAFVTSLAATFGGRRRDA